MAGGLAGAGSDDGTGTASRGSAGAAAVVVAVSGCTGLAASPRGNARASGDCGVGAGRAPLAATTAGVAGAALVARMVGPVDAGAVAGGGVVEAPAMAGAVSAGLNMVAGASPSIASVVKASALLSPVVVTTGSAGAGDVSGDGTSESTSPNVAAKPCATTLGRPIAPGNPANALPTISMQSLSRRGLPSIIGGSRAKRGQLTVPSARMRARAWISFCESTTVDGRTRSMIERTNGRTLGLVSKQGISPFSARRS